MGENVFDFCRMPVRLDKLCITTIAHNFPRYNLAFTTSDDENMKQMLEFLRIKYSYDLLVRLRFSKEGAFMEKYLDFLINKHLRSIDTSWFRNCSWEKIVSKVAEIGSNIEKFSLYTNYPSDLIFYKKQQPLQDIFCCLPNLRVVYYYYDFSELMFKHIAEYCPGIEEIYIHCNYTLSMKDVKYLCKNEKGEAVCTKLKRLRFHDIDFESFKYMLRHLKSLEDVHFLDMNRMLYEIYKDDANYEPHNISNLLLSPVFNNVQLYNDVLKTCLHVCPRVKYLKCFLLHEENLLVFPNLPDLQELNITNCRKSPFGFNLNKILEASGRKLTCLGISTCSVSISVIAENCPCLRELYLREVHFLLDSNSKPTFSSLTSITLDDYDISKYVRAITVLLSSSKKLESLKVKKCNLLSSEIKFIVFDCCKHFPLKKISFKSSLVEKQFVKDILSICPSLCYLNILNCFVDVNDKIEVLSFAKNMSIHLEIKM